MSLQATARAAFAASLAAFPAGVVSLSYDGRSTTGRRNGSVRGQVNVYGNTSAQSDIVWYDASKMDEPPPGATVVVDGANVIVSGTAPDSEGALVRLEYQVTAPVAGI